MQSLLGKSTGVDDEQVEEWLHEDARNQEYYEKANIISIIIILVKKKYTKLI